MLDVVLAIGLVIVGLLRQGRIPFGVLIGRWFWGIDVRDYGSGNIGTTNVFRVLGTKAGVLVLACDMGKGLPADVPGDAVPAAVGGGRRRARDSPRAHVLGLLARQRRQGGRHGGRGDPRAHAGGVPRAAR